MKRTIINSVVILAFMLGACKNSTDKNEQTKSTDATTSESENTSQTFELDTTKLKTGDTFYQCSMDPEVLSDKPGSCPKCGMDLSEMKKQ